MQHPLRPTPGGLTPRGGSPCLPAENSRPSLGDSGVHLRAGRSLGSVRLGDRAPASVPGGTGLPCAPPRLLRHRDTPGATPGRGSRRPALRGWTWMVPNASQSTLALGAPPLGQHGGLATASVPGLTVWCQHTAGQSGGDSGGTGMEVSGSPRLSSLGSALLPLLQGARSLQNGIRMTGDQRSGSATFVSHPGRRCSQ